MDVQVTKAKQAWAVGNKVTVGGREYFVIGQEEVAPQKGLARAWVISTEDQSQQYKYRPWRGLEMMNGQPVKRKRNRKKATSQPVTTQAPASPRAKKARMRSKGSLWSRLAAAFGLRVKPRRKVTITRPPGADIDTQPRAE